MTAPQAPQQQYRSSNSNRYVVPGWTNLVANKPDVVEIQLDVSEVDLQRQHASLLIEYWADETDLTLQSVLPMRAFGAAGKDGWCVFAPAQGRVLIRAIDPQPDPPILASHWINIDPETVPGTVVNVAISFPNSDGSDNSSASDQMQLNKN